MSEYFSYIALILFNICLAIYACLNINEIRKWGVQKDESYNLLLCINSIALVGIIFAILDFTFALVNQPVYDELTKYILISFYLSFEIYYTLLFQILMLRVSKVWMQLILKDMYVKISNIIFSVFWIAITLMNVVLQIIIIVNLRDSNTREFLTLFITITYLVVISVFSAIAIKIYLQTLKLQDIQNKTKRKLKFLISFTILGGLYRIVLDSIQAFVPNFHTNMKQLDADCISKKWYWAVITFSIYGLANCVPYLCIITFFEPKYKQQNSILMEDESENDKNQSYRYSLLQSYRYNSIFESCKMNKIKEAQNNLATSSNTRQDHPSNFFHNSNNGNTANITSYKQSGESSKIAKISINTDTILHEDDQETRD